MHTCHAYAGGEIPEAAIPSAGCLEAWGPSSSGQPLDSIASVQRSSTTEDRGAGGGNYTRIPVGQEDIREEEDYRTEVDQGGTPPVEMLLDPQPRNRKAVDSA
jgi:hypothetical protein